MRLLPRVSPQWQLLLRPATWFSAGLVLTLAALEVVGRQAATDLHDAVAVAVLSLLAVVVALRHRTEPLGWVGWFSDRGQWLTDRLRGWLFEVGIDLRGTPPVPRAAPSVVTALTVGLLAWVALAALFGTGLPTDLRQFTAPYFYLGYLLLLAGLWTMLAVATLLALFIPVALIHDTCVAAHRGPLRRPRRWEFALIGLYFTALMAFGLLTPPWAGLAVCAAALLVTAAAVLWPGAGGVQFLWRSRGGGPARAIPWGGWVLGEFGLIGLALLALVLTACGPDGAVSALAQRPAMPVTTMMGIFLAWLAPGLLTLLAAQTVAGRLRDPARPVRPVLNLGGRIPADRRDLARKLARLGWRPRFGPTASKQTDVRVELVAPAESQADEFDPGWPLRLAPADLDRPMVQDRLARRHEIQMRRQVVAGLRTVFKQAAKRRYRSGHGFWVAPHFWFVTGLTRDAPEEELDLHDGSILSGTIGPPYHRVLSRAARRHLFEMLRAVQVDLIFVEDGLGYRRLVRVLRLLFELYDRHAGRRRAEESHFRGLPGTRVLIHEFTLDEPFRSTTYPEPKYDYLGRARILHVFRDRGEHEEPIESPYDMDRSPAPSALGG